MAEPSLSEITGIRGNADLALGRSGAFGQVINPNPSIQYLAAASQAKGQANKHVYEQFKQNLDNHLANFNQINVEGVMDADSPEIVNQYKDLAGKMAEKFDVIMNPFKDPEAAAELRRAEAELRGKIAQSKGQKLILDQHKQFLNNHPSFNTDTNQAKILDFQNKNREERQAFTLDTPFNFDPTALAKAANDVARQKLATAVTDGKYITKEQRTKILEDAYNEAWSSAASTQDQFGRTIFQNANDAFANLPASERSNYATVDQWFKEVGKGLMQQDQIESADINEDQYGVSSQRFKESMAMQNDAQKHDAWQAALDREIANRRLSLDAATLKRGEVDVRAAGILKNQLLTQAFSTGKPDLNAMQQVYGDNTPIEVKSNPTGYDAAGNSVPVISETKPRTQVISTSLTNDGKLRILTRDNKTGKTNNAIYRTIEDADVDFNNILGRDKAINIADGSRNYLKEIGIDNVDLPKMQDYFNFPTPNDEKFNAPGGKSYTRKQLKDAGYSDAQIEQAVRMGNLKK